jgi:hypothetical protein
MGDGPVAGPDDLRAAVAAQILDLLLDAVHRLRRLDELLHTGTLTGFQLPALTVGGIPDSLELFRVLLRGLRHDTTALLG